MASPDADAEEVADEFEALHEIYGVDGFVRELVHDPADHWWCKVTLRERGDCTIQAELPLGYPSTAKPAAISASLGPQHPRSSAATVVLTAELNAALATFVAEELDYGPSIYMLVSFVEEWCDDHDEDLLNAAEAAAAAAATTTKTSSGDRTQGSTKAGGNKVGDAGGGDGGAAEVILLERQWIWFIGFYTKSIIKAFCSTAAEHGCTGFLMPGKPAVAAVEGTPAAIARFIKVTRTELFATVPPASRKMTLTHVDTPIKERTFADFQWLELNAAANAHKRKDMADLGNLEVWLTARGLGDAFQHIFGAALNT